MIKANELRVFNYVFDNDHNQWVKVVTIDYYEAQAVWVTDEPLGYKYKTSCSRLSGIPITPEILEKCRFEQVDHIEGYSFWAMNKKRRDIRKPAVSIYENRTLFNGYLVPQHCQYLHQLQNLYFSLTGEELTINL